MIYLSDAELDALLLEDIYRGDLTTQALGIADVPAVITFRRKNAGSVAGSAIAAALLRKLGLAPHVHLADGAHAQAGGLILQAQGSAAQVHQGWKVAQLVLEWSCGVAQNLADMLARARAVNPQAAIACTRKSIPNTRKLATAAVLAAGGSIHRQGLSETLLVFTNHRNLCAKPDDWADIVARLRTAAPENTVTLEADNLAQVEAMLAACSDIIQLDKFPLADVKAAQALAAQHGNATRLSVAGSIHKDNIAAYAATGINIFITSAPYYAAPQDVKVSITAA
jgi:modD protein